MKNITRKFCVVCKQNFGLSAFDGHASKTCRVCKTRITKKKPKGQPMRSPNQMKRIASDCFNKQFDKVPAEFHELIYENESLWVEMGGR